MKSINTHYSGYLDKPQPLVPKWLIVSPICAIVASVVVSVLILKDAEDSREQQGEPVSKPAHKIIDTADKR